MKLDRPTIGIIGGTGSMGSWFADLLEKSGLKVFRVGRKTRLSPAQAAQQCDVVVISVPMAHTVGMIQEIGPLVSEDQLLMDLTSVKKGPMAAMLKCSRAQVVGAHPLFGHDISSSSELRIVICPGRGETGLNWLKGTLRDAGYHVTVLSPEEHDHIMGLVQGVNHFSTLALGLCICRSGLKFEDIVNCSTQTFINRVDRIRAILEQPSALFGSLLMQNPASRQFIKQYQESVDELMRITEQGDKEVFGQFFESLRRFFSRT